jgi:hypothetical protein
MKDKKKSSDWFTTVFPWILTVNRREVEGYYRNTIERDKLELEKDFGANIINRPDIYLVAYEPKSGYVSPRIIIRHRVSNYLMPITLAKRSGSGETIFSSDDGRNWHLSISDALNTVWGDKSYAGRKAWFQYSPDPKVSYVSLYEVWNRDE